jgi:hypothetical protein
VEVSHSSSANLLRYWTTCVTVSQETQIQSQALSIYFLEVPKRFRFVRGFLKKEESNDLVFGLETVVPFHFARILAPECAIESLLAAFSHIKPACEALLHENIAAAYLQQRFRIHMTN